MPKLCVGVLRNTFNYNVSKLIKTFFGYRCVFVDTLRCSDVSVAKNVALSKFDDLRNTVPVVVDRFGCHYYFHSKYRKWYKNLDENQLKKYFNWLSA